MMRRKTRHCVEAPNRTCCIRGTSSSFRTSRTRHLGVSRQANRCCEAEKDLQPLEDDSPADRSENRWRTGIRLTFEGGRSAEKRMLTVSCGRRFPWAFSEARLEIGKETRHSRSVSSIRWRTPRTRVSTESRDRLKNLGFYEGPMDGKTNPELGERFAHSNRSRRLPETGEADEETLDKILDIHGS